MLDLNGPRPKRSSEVPARVKVWAREHLGLDENVTVMVTELRCSEPGCPPLETVIAVLDGGNQNRQYKIHKPMDEVAQTDVQNSTLHDAHPEGPHEPC